MKELYSHFSGFSTHTIGERETTVYPDCDKLIVPCTIKIYENPDEEQEIGAEPAGEFLGTIRGMVVLGREIELLCPHITNHDLYMNQICDDLDAALGFVVSSLIGNRGPLSRKRTVFGCNHFYIDDLDMKRPELLPRILRELPKIVFTHIHVFPEIISYYPRQLPHEEKMTEEEKMLYDAANQTCSAILSLMLDGKYDMNNPQLVLTPEQINLLHQNRTGYSEKYIDSVLWKPFIEAGFREWNETRVLYKSCER